MKVSIIMSAYNGAEYIAESIQSVMDQTYNDWELIIIDDGSTDQTRNIVLELQKRDGRIKYFFQNNTGQGKARNAGIERSQGEWIAFLDQDDLWIEDKLELQTEVIRKSGADVIFSNGFMFHNKDVYNESATFLVEDGRFEGQEMINRLFIQNRIPILTALVRKNLLVKIGLIDDDLAIKNCDDYDLWLRLAEHGAIFIGMPENLARYRLHHHQASKNVIQQYKAEIAVIERHSHKVTLDKKQVQRRFRRAYRDVVSALVNENNFSEARKYLYRQLYRDGFGIITLLQNMIVWIWPSRYTSFSYILYRLRERLYWPVANRMDRLRRSLSH